MSSNPINARNGFGELGLALPQSAAQKKAQLGQADFLKLMTTQLQNQDPTKPMDNAQFLGQIAQFSTVSGIQGLQDAFAGLSASMQSAQTLQASQLVGHEVLVPGAQGVLDHDGLSGAVAVPASGPVSVEVLDAAGQVVRRIDLGLRPEGLTHFRWDGVNAAGERMADGPYRLRASLQQPSGTQALETLALDRVGSVAVAPDGITLHLAALGPTALAGVRQIF